jgi:ATP-binding cassette subfamily D (ALD) long-chain fatty acid import protein
MYSGKEISELVGYTNRVYGLLGALHTLDTDSYPTVNRPAHLSSDKVRPAPRVINLYYLG